MHMRRLLISIFLSVILLLAPLTDGAQQSSAGPKPQSTTPVSPSQESPQKSDQKLTTHVNLVDVLFTVLDRRNKLVPALEKTDFKIFDDKLPQEIRYFSKQSDLPLRIGILLDTSNSIRDRIKFEQDASINFLFTVLRHNKDEAFAMTFDDEPQIIQPFTGDAGALRDQITKTRAGGGTAIYVVIYAISTSIQWISLTQNNEPAKSGDRKYHLTDGDKILQELAEETGGRSFYPYHVDDLDQSFQDIGDELRNQYSIAYLPTNYVLDGRYHKIRIEVPDHKGYQVRARRGYFASANANLPPAAGPSGEIR